MVRPEQGIPKYGNDTETPRGLEHTDPWTPISRSFDSVVLEEGLRICIFQQILSDGDAEALAWGHIGRTTGLEDKGR